MIGDTRGDFENIYTPENIARSRTRAQHLRERVRAGELPDGWLLIAEQIESYADEREALL